MFFVSYYMNLIFIFDLIKLLYAFMLLQSYCFDCIHFFKHFTTNFVESINYVFLCSQLLFSFFSVLGCGNFCDSFEVWFEVPLISLRFLLILWNVQRRLHFWGQPQPPFQNDNLNKWIHIVCLINSRNGMNWNEYGIIDDSFLRSNITPTREFTHVPIHAMATAI